MSTFVWIACGVSAWFAGVAICLGVAADAARGDRDGQARL